MAAVPIDQLPDSARVWVFATSAALSPAAEARLLSEADAFVADWRAHGVPLRAAVDWRDGRFLCVAVDQEAVGASGCSIDGLYRTVRALEPELGASVVAGGQLFWRGADGVVVNGPRETFVALTAVGQIGGGTLVFDPTITSLGEWRRSFERPAAASWHARWLVSPTE